MSNEERGAHLPPSSARLAAASRAGLFPRSPLLPAGAALAAFGLASSAFGRAIADGFSALVHRGFETALGSRPDPVAALLEALSRGALIALALVVAPALGAGLAVLVPALVAKRRSGSTAVALPEMPRSPVRRAVLFGAAIAIAALVIAHGFAAARPAFALLALGDPSALRPLATRLAASAAAAGAALVLLGLADISLERIRLIEALKLTKSEGRRENGVPETARRLRRAP